MQSVLLNRVVGRNGEAEGSGHPQSSGKVWLSNKKPQLRYALDNDVIRNCPPERSLINLVLYSPV